MWEHGLVASELLSGYSSVGTGECSVASGRGQGAERVEGSGPFCVLGKFYTLLAEAPAQLRSSGPPSGRGLRLGGRGGTVGAEERKGPPHTSWEVQICVGR